MLLTIYVCKCKQSGALYSPLQDGYMSPAQLDNVNESILRLLAEIRPNAVALVDSFDFTDHVLGSILGRYDGNVYENMYKWALESPLNKTQVRYQPVRMGV